MSVRVYVKKTVLDSMTSVEGIDLVAYVPRNKRSGYAWLYVAPEAVVYFNSLGVKAEQL